MLRYSGTFCISDMQNFDMALSENGMMPFSYKLEIITEYLGL